LRRYTRHTGIEDIGVVLLNLGGPDSLKAVRPFLYNLFSDRSIIKLGPPFLQKPLAWLISALRSWKTGKMYRLIGGRSPILDITVAQARALEERLNSSRFVSRPFKVYVGMRYWRPFIDETIEQAYRDGVRSLVAISLYPHYSAATSGSAVSRFNDVVRRYPIKSLCISSWFDHPLYIDALVDVIKKGLGSFQPPDDIHVLFSAHSLPAGIVEAGDPYVSHINATIGGVLKRMALQWHLSFQSRSGPVRWLEPSTDALIRELAGRGIKNLLIVPISFVSDHVETLYEIDILYKRLADRLGVKLIRTESLNTHPLFIEALEDMVIRAVKEHGWTGLL